MRGQRPALATVLAWLTVLVLVLGSLPMLGQASALSLGTAPQAPLEEGGGEGRLAEPAPAKLRRQAPIPPPPPRHRPPRRHHRWPAGRCGCRTSWT